ncbi:MAG: hypothetical protein SNG47_02705 [Rikenellaceae bacterium]
MKRFLLSIVVVFMAALAQAQVVEILCDMGMEDIRSAEVDGNTYVSFENTRYRGTYTGIGEAVKALVGGYVTGDLNIVATISDNPELAITIPAELLEGYKSGKVSLTQIYEKMAISYDVDPLWSELRHKPIDNSASFKVDFVIYPELMVDNSRFSPLYSYYFNLSPALEVQLWRGGHFTGQIVIPVVTNQSGVYERVRMGVLAISQEFYLGKGFQAKIDAGNFTGNRLGVQGSVNWSTKSGRLALYAKLGRTISSEFGSDGLWHITPGGLTNAAITATIYEPKTNLRFDLQASKYLYGDIGVRADCTRYFGEYAVGGFVVCSEGDFNCGFNVAIPLGSKRYMKNNYARIRPADYFGLNYSMSSWGDFVDNKLAIGYDVVPNANRSSDYYQPEYIRYFILKTETK